MYEALNNCTNGEDIWTHTTLSPILNEKGEVTHLVTVDSNIHKKKEARDELVNSIIHFTEHIDKLTGNLETLARVSNRFFETSDRTNSSLEETDAVLAIIRDLTMSLRLLGFNASIEANHLAEKAKGFRVIANEIVGISKNTEDATSKIRETFDSIKEVSAKLIKDKDRTEDVFGDHRKIIDVLKKELDIIERAAVKLK
jgi:methyl-accepting chemotaxis protein